MTSRRRSDRRVRWLTNTHRFLLRISGGRLGSHLLGMETLELHTVGRRTGAPRSALLTAPIQDDDRVVFVASKGGADEHPSWYVNLVANPDVQISSRGVTRRYRARTATAEERAALWPRIVEVNPGYAGYQRRTDRVIPVVICERVDGD